MQAFAFEIRGSSPLLMHADSIEWADQMTAYRHAPKDKNQKDTPGDDRSPAWRWIGYLYHDHKNVVMPAANVQRCLSVAATRVPDPNGRGGKTFKSNVMSQILIETPEFDFFGSKGQIPMEPFAELVGNEPDFAKHAELALKYGFQLDVRRAKPKGASGKHIRVRPKFDKWTVRGSIVVLEPALVKAIPSIFEIAGNQIGLGDWRPSSPTPGAFGKFTTELKEIRAAKAA